MGGRYSCGMRQHSPYTSAAPSTGTGGAHIVHGMRIGRIVGVFLTIAQLAHKCGWGVPDLERDRGKGGL